VDWKSQSATICATIKIYRGKSLDLTSEHPMMTLGGWKAIDPDKTKQENASIPVAAMTTADSIGESNGSYDQIAQLLAGAQQFRTYIYF